MFFCYFQTQNLSHITLTQDKVKVQIYTNCYPISYKLVRNKSNRNLAASDTLGLGTLALWKFYQYEK